MYYSSVGPDTGKRLDPHRYRYGVGCRLDPASGVRSQESGQHADGTRRRVRCRLDLLNRDLSDLKRPGSEHGRTRPNRTTKSGNFEVFKDYF